MYTNTIDTVVFDFHGTITDHNKRLLESIRQAAASSRMPPQVTEALIAGLYNNRGDSEDFKDYVERICEHCSMYDLLKEDVLPIFFSLRSQLMDQIYLPVEDMAATINTLRRMGVRIVFVTNGTIAIKDKKELANLPLFKDAGSYSDVIYDLLVNHWQVYSGQEGDIPLIVSPKDDMDHFRAQPTNTKIAKPMPELMEGLGRVIVSCLGGAFDPSRTLLVGDYQTDSDFAFNIGAHCAFHLKGKNQLLTEYNQKNDDQSRPREYPYIHMAELPYLVATNGAVTRELIPIRISDHSSVYEGVVVNVRLEDETIYAVKVSFAEFGKVEFLQHVPIQELMVRYGYEPPFPEHRPTSHRF